jgi:hypothetical protein
MTSKQQPRWRSIDDLPLIASFIDGTVENTEEQYQFFSLFRNKIDGPKRNGKN